jgi:phage shock protein PspC (stress-responsive transcriptional regulator)
MTTKAPKKDLKKTVIRVICFILALSMVIGTLYMLYAYLVAALA